MNSETVLMREIQIEASKRGWRLFRNNVGVAYTLNPLTKKLRRIKFGLCVGSADLIGFTDKGRFVAVEIKTETGKVSGKQWQFIKVVRMHGGMGVIARELADIFP